MTDVIIAQNCPRCGREPVAYTSNFGMGTRIKCPDQECVDAGMTAFGLTIEDATVAWNRVKE